MHGIYTNYSKAFDCVDRSVLFAKLCALGIARMALKWLDTSLLKRLQCVKINTFFSNKFLVPFGVLQDSHCGPVFFKIFLNDVGAFLTSRLLRFADDMKT